MISIICTNCQAHLTIDDAFAGGVCRCQHCGAIQTVPKTAKAGAIANGDTMAGGPVAPKTLWRGKGVSEGAAGTGLEDLADVVASSGLQGSGLRSGRLRRASPASQKKKPNRWLLLGLGGGLLLLGIAAIVLIIVSNKSASSAPDETSPDHVAIDNGKTAATPAAEPAIDGPSFAGVKLNGSTIVYVLDRGSGTSSVFGQLTAMTKKSVASLGSDRKFQVIFWQVHDEVVSYPDTGTTVAGDLSMNELSRHLDNVSAFGSSAAGPALQMAAKAKPDVIILATGKGDDLDDSFVAEVDAARPANVPIDTFAVGSSHAIAALQAIAKKSGGEYRTLDDAAMAKFGQ